MKALTIVRSVAPCLKTSLINKFTIKLLESQRDTRTTACSYLGTSHLLIHGTHIRKDKYIQSCCQ